MNKETIASKKINIKRSEAFCIICPTNSSEYPIDPNHCYFFSSTSSDWVNAEYYCNYLNGSLVSIHDSMLNSLILGTTEALNYGDIWIGANTLLSAKNWAWTDGTPFDFKNWEDGEPQSTNKCGYLLVNSWGKWSTQNCSQEKKFSCTVPPFNLETYSISPTSTEVTKATSSISSQCSFFSTISENWIEAENYCKNIKKHLVSIHSANDNQIVLSTAQKCVSDVDNYFWLGLYNQDGNWTWSDGTQLDWENWKNGEPNNLAGANCAVLNLTDGYWIAQDCTLENPFPCTFLTIGSSPTQQITKVPTKSTSSPFNNIPPCSIFSTETKDWRSAEEYCKSIGKHLVSIHSKNENNNLQTAAKECISNFDSDIWIGLYINENRGGEGWSDGTPVDFNVSDGPGINMEEYCYTLSLKDGTWKAQNCSLKMPFSCSINGSAIFPSTTTNSPKDPESSAKWWTIGVVLVVFFSLTAAIIIYFLRIKYRRIKEDEIQKMIKTKMEMSPLEIQLSHEERLTKQLDPKNVIIDFDNILGKGSNATVYKAFLKGKIQSNLTQSNLKFAVEDNSQAAIKVPKSFDHDEVEQFVRELDALITLGSHSHIITFLGWTLYHDIPALVTELANKNLLQFVNSFRGEILPIKTIISILWQISQALEHVASLMMVHRDVACRNILLTENNVAKLADFGLCCHCDESFIYHATIHKRLPLKWLSIEALVNRIFSQKSDVWSFGILCFEIFSFGKVPYLALSNEEMVEFLQNGNRLEKPNDTPDSIYSLMLDCWKMDPADRPKFQEIGNILRIMLEQETASYGYLTLDNER